MSILQLQFFVLLGGTAFAWYNFALEYVRCRQGKKGSCSAGGPFLSPCFGGAVFFTIAFVLNLLLQRV